MNNSKPDKKIQPLYRLLEGIHLHKNGYDEAIRYLTETLDGNFYPGESYFHRGFLYFQKREYRKSQDDINRAKAFGYRVSEEYIDNLFMRSQKGMG